MAPSPRLTLLLLLLLSLAALVRAAAYTKPLCLYACRNCVDSVRFRDVPQGTSAGAASCESALKLTSLYLCMDARCGAGARDDGLGLLNETCREDFGLSVPPFETVVANYTLEDIAKLRRVNGMDDPPAKEVFEEPVMVSAEYFRLWFGTLVCAQCISRSSRTNGIAGRCWICQDLPLSLRVRGRLLSS